MGDALAAGPGEAAARAKRLVLGLREGLERLEAAEQGGALPGDQAALAAGLRGKHSELMRVCHALEPHAKGGGPGPGREGAAVWKRKVEQLCAECDSIGLALEKHSGRVQRRQVEQMERAELLMRRKEGDAFASASKQVTDEEGMRRSVAQSNQVLEQILGQGASILGNMGAQRERLKRAQKKALDMLNVLGLSESLLKIAERRQRVDKAIVYGGMVTTLLVVLLFVWLY